MELRVGQVVRYGEGKTAIMKIVDFGFGGRVYGEHVLGGPMGADLEQLTEASMEDIHTWKQRTQTDNQE